MYANRFFTFVVILAFVAVIALTVREAVATSAIALDPGAQEAQRLQRSQAADAARWTASGDYYKKLELAQIQRSRAADTTRWNAMVGYYRLINLATP